MNKNVLFYLDETLEINKMVQKDIGSHLFLFCNYNPEGMRTFGADARFIQAVMNLYKLLIDSGIVNRIPSMGNLIGLNKEMEILRKYIDLSRTIRTVAGHNLSKSNGTEDKIVQYDRWMIGVIGKKEPDCEGDYDKPLLELEGIANDSLRLVRIFVNKAKGSQKKAEVMREWEENIIRYYCKGNMDIFMGQLRDAYISVHRRAYADERLTGYELSVWIREACYCPEEKSIQYLLSILDKSSIKKNQDRRNIQNKIDEYQRAIDERKREVASFCKCEVDEVDNNLHRYKDHYCSKLETKLRDALIKIKQDGSGTMLPQDIMQMIIDQDFKLTGTRPKQPGSNNR